MIQKNIPAVSVDTLKDRYKLSRFVNGDHLLQSAGSSGIVRPPVVVADGDRYIAVTGHNRISAAVKLGLDEITVQVHDSIEAETIINEIVLKSYHREIGPSGRIKGILLLEKEFSMDRETLYSLARDRMGVPEWVLQDPSFIRAFESPAGGNEALF